MTQNFFASRHHLRPQALLPSVVPSGQQLTLGLAIEILI